MPNYQSTHTGAQIDAAVDKALVIINLTGTSGSVTTEQYTTLSGDYAIIKLNYADQPYTFTKQTSNNGLVYKCAGIGKINISTGRAWLYTAETEQTVENKINSITSAATDDKYPSAKAVYDLKKDAAHIDAGAATDGQVLTADGSGGAAWETPSSGTAVEANPAGLTNSVDVLNGITIGSTNYRVKRVWAYPGAAPTTSTTTHYAVGDLLVNVNNNFSGYGITWVCTSVTQDDTTHWTATWVELATRVATGAGAPSSSTVGYLGKLYINTTNNSIYACTGQSGASSYTWVQVGTAGTTDFNDLSNRPKYNGSAMTGSTNIPQVKTSAWDAKSTVTGTNDSTNWTSLTVDGNTYNIPAAILTYVKSASVSNNTLTLTLQNNSTVTFTPANVITVEPKTSGTVEVTVGNDGITVEKQITTTDENGGTNDIMVTDKIPLIARANGGLVVDENSGDTLVEIGIDYTGANEGQVLTKTSSGAGWTNAGGDDVSFGSNNEIVVTSGSNTVIIPNPTLVGTEDELESVQIGSTKFKIAIKEAALSGTTLTLTI